MRSTDPTLGTKHLLDSATHSALAGVHGLWVVQINTNKESVCLERHRSYEKGVCLLQEI